MGLDYSYLLYFKRDKVWDALQGVVQVSSHHLPPAKIVFPDRQLSIPLRTWSWNHQEIHHDDQKLEFQLAMYFSGKDTEIIEYNRAMGNEGPDRSPPDDANENKILVGLIYLTVFLNDSDYSSGEHVLFKFKAAGTTMSILFVNSPSIQKGFKDLLEKNHGVSGVLDREDGGGMLFWFQGRSYEMDIYDAYMKPVEVEELLQKHK